MIHWRKTVNFIKDFAIIYRFAKLRTVGGNAAPTSRLLLQLDKTVPTRRWDSLAPALNICVVTTQLVTDVFDLGLVTLNLADSSVADFTTSVETRTCATPRRTHIVICLSHQTLHFHKLILLDDCNKTCHRKLPSDSLRLLVIWWLWLYKTEILVRAVYTCSMGV